MPTVTVRQAQPQDAKAIGENLRPADAREVAISAVDPVEDITFGIENARRCFTLEVDEEPAAIFGSLNAAKAGEGIVWLLGTPLLDTIGSRLARDSHDWLEQLSAGYKVVGNLVDMKNTKAIRWLEWMGFQFNGRAYTTDKGTLVQFSKEV